MLPTSSRGDPPLPRGPSPSNDIAHPVALRHHLIPPPSGESSQTMDRSPSPTPAPAPPLAQDNDQPGLALEPPTSAPTPVTDDSAPSSTSSTPEPVLDDDGDFFLHHSNESQSSYGGSTSQATTRDHSPTRDVSDEEPIRNPIDSLPTELLMYTFSKLTSPNDLFSCMRVSKTWARCCVDLLWHRPLLTSRERLQNVAEALQKQHPHWRYADLIRRLNLSTLSSVVNDGTLTPFAQCKRIERLTLTNCSHLTDQGLLSLIVGNRSLLALDITGITSITDATVEALATNCPRLQGLNVTGLQRLTDASLTPLAQSCRHLKRLKLNRCVQITDESICAFASRCPSMLEIDLQNCENISDHSVVSLLLGGRFLREIRLASCTNVTDRAFVNLPSEARFESLRILDLTACISLTDAAVEAIIDSAPRLRILVLAKCIELTDRSVLAITKLGKNLHDIHLGRCHNITDDALKELVRCCNRIRYIDLAGCNRVTDASVKQLATLPKLRRIGLVKCHSITDRSILALARSQLDGRRSSLSNSLERVHLSYCINVSVPGIHELLTSCRRLTHLSLTGIQAFYVRDDLVSFCREAPSEFNDDQRNVFCVFSGEGVNRLRDHLNIVEQVDRREYVASVLGTPDPLDQAHGGLAALMQGTQLDGEEFDE